MGPQLSTSGAEPVELSRDDLFSMLRNERRREVIHYLREHEAPVDLRDLSEYIAAIENDCTPAEVTYKQRKRVQTALYQMHLPKLAEAGYIAWDADTHTIRRGPNFDENAPLLRVMADHEDEPPGLSTSRL